MRPVVICGLGISIVLRREMEFVGKEAEKGQRDLENSLYIFWRA